MELMILAVIAFVFGGIWGAIFGRNWRKTDDDSESIRDS